METIIALALLQPEPQLTDRYRFPPKEVAKQAMEFNKAYRQYVASKQVMELHNWYYWQDVLNETDCLYHCWDWLHAAQGGEGRDENYWLKSLSELKMRIGDKAYYAGQMPQNVPLYRFTYK